MAFYLALIVNAVHYAQNLTIVAFAGTPQRTSGNLGESNVSFR